MGSRDGEEDYKAPSVDEGRYPDTENTRARNDKNGGDRAEAEAELCSDPAEGMDTWYCARGNSEEESVNLVRWAGSAIPQVRCEGRMSQKDIGACFEIKVDGKTRSYRDQKETALEAGKYLKQLQPKVEVSVHDLRDNSVTVIGGEEIIVLDAGAGGKR